MSRPVVRRGELGDVQAVVAIGHLTWPTTYTAIAGADYVRRGLDKWWTIDGIRRAVESGSVLVAESDDGIVGMASYPVGNASIDIWKLYVLPEAQDAGTGSDLLRAVIEGPGEGLLVRLAHQDGNTKARYFYERHGFVETHRTPDELGGPDNVWMARTR